MTIVCEPDELAKAAACYCGPSKLQQGEIVYLLQKISGDTSTPSELAKKAACYCFPEKVWRAVVAYLLCQTVNGGAACASQSGTTDPGGVVTPAFIGQLYHNTTADTYFYSTGLTSADWTAIGGSGAITWQPDNTVFDGELRLSASYLVTDISLGPITSVGQLTMNGNGGLLTFSAPNFVQDTNGNGSLVTNNNALQSIDMPQLIGGPWSWDFSNNDTIQSFNLPLLASVGGDLWFWNSFTLPSLSLPSLVTVGGNFTNNACAMLTSFSAPNWVPTDGTVITFNGDALDATSVELILRRCVLAGVTTCTINLAGGTNAGLASLSAQGQADAVTLGAQLTVNP